MVTPPTLTCSPEIPPVSCLMPRPRLPSLPKESWVLWAAGDICSGPWQQPRHGGPQGPVLTGEYVGVGIKLGKTGWCPGSRPECKFCLSISRLFPAASFICRYMFNTCFLAHLTPLCPLLSVLTSPTLFYLQALYPGQPCSPAHWVWNEVLEVHCSCAQAGCGCWVLGVFSCQ